MKLIRRLLDRTFGRRPPVVRPADPERLQRIYRETHRRVEELRRAA